MHKTLDLEVEGLQQQKTTSAFSSVNQEQKPAAAAGSQKLDT